jgi:Domain of unknown function (DUF1844)
MADKPPAFTVTDRRKFTVDGDLRSDAATEETAAPAPAATPAPASAPLSPEMVHPAPGRMTANVAEAVRPAPGVPMAASPNLAEAVHPAPGVPLAAGARVVTMPSPAATPATPVPVPPQPSPVSDLAASAPPEDLHETMGDAGEEGDALPEPTAAESAEQHAAYRESSQQLDDMIRMSNPGAKASAVVTMEHVLQSIYLSAVVAMGAATEPGQKPRIDILGARQSIDMLTVLQEKTKGNLNEKEQRLLQNMLFELRMMFLEITNAIAQQAQNPPPGIIR